MVTAYPATDEAIMPEKQSRNTKQVQINREELRSYIDPVIERVRQNSQILYHQAKNLRPPYPLESLESVYHSSEMELICHSAMLQMLAELKTIPVEEWKFCYAEYKKLPVRSPGMPDRYKGIESPAFSDEMFTLAEKIGSYLEVLDLNIAYLRRKNAINSQLIANVSLIWLGRKLIAENESVSQSSDKQ
jgi:hypothetical protein